MHVDSLFCHGACMQQLFCSPILQSDLWAPCHSLTPAHNTIQSTFHPFLSPEAELPTQWQWKILPTRFRQLDFLRTHQIAHDVAALHSTGLSDHKSISISSSSSPISSDLSLLPLPCAAPAHLTILSSFCTGGSWKESCCLHIPAFPMCFNLVLKVTQHGYRENINLFQPLVSPFLESRMKVVWGREER